MKMKYKIAYILGLIVGFFISLLLSPFYVMEYIFIDIKCRNLIEDVFYKISVKTFKGKDIYTECAGKDAVNFAENFSENIAFCDFINPFTLKIERI